MPVNNNKGQYLISLQNGESEMWNDMQYAKRRDQLFNDFPTATATRVQDYDPQDDDIQDTDSFFVQVGDENEEWDAATFNHRKNQLFTDFPQAKVKKLRRDDYWGEQGDAQRRAIAKRIDDISVAEKSIHDAASEEFKAEKGNQSFFGKLMENLASAGRANSDPFGYADPSTYQGWLNTTGREKYGNDLKNYQAAEQTLKEAQELQNELTKENAQASDSRLKAFFKGNLQGQKKYVNDIESWNQVVAGENAAAMYGLQQKIEKIIEGVGDDADGTAIEKAIQDGLTPSERSLFDAIQASGSVMSSLQPKIAGSVKAGEVMAASERMGLEFLLFNGIAGAANRGVARNVEKYLTKRLVKDGAGKVARKLGTAAAKVLAADTGALVGGGIQTTLGPSNWSGIAKNAEDTMQAFLSSPAAFMNPETRAQYGIEGPKAMGELALDGAVQYLTENATEFGLGPVNKLLGGLGKAGYRGLRKMGWNRLATLLSPQASAFLNKAGIGNLLEETGEEVNGAIIDYFSGNKDALKDFGSMENLGILMSSFIPTIGLGAGVSAVQRGVYNNRYNKAADAYRAYLVSQGIDESEADAIIESLDTETPEELGRRAGKLYQALDQRQGGDKATEATLLTNLITAARNRSLANGVNQLMLEESRGDTRDNIMDNTKGRQFWQTREADMVDEGGTPYKGEEEYVDFLTTSGDNNFFIRNEDEDGNIETVDENGTVRRFTAEEVEQGLADGTFTGRRTMDMNDYLDERSGIQRDKVWQVSSERVSQMASYQSAVAQGSRSIEDVAYDAQQSLARLGAEAVEAGVEADELENSSEELAHAAFEARQEGNVDLANALSAYADAKATVEGLHEGYISGRRQRAEAAVDQQINAYARDKKISSANLGGKPIFIVDKDAAIARDGSVVVIKGSANSKVQIIDPTTGKTSLVSPAELSGAWSAPVEDYRQNAVDVLMGDAEQRYNTAVNTMSRPAMAEAVTPLVGHTAILTNENGEASPVTVVAVNPQAFTATVRDGSRKGQMNEVGIDVLYNQLQKNADGSIVLDATATNNKVEAQPEAQQPEQAPAQAPAQQPATQSDVPINNYRGKVMLNGELRDVQVTEVDRDGTVQYDLLDSDGEAVGSAEADTPTFRAMIAAAQTPAPVQEVSEAPAAQPEAPAEPKTPVERYTDPQTGKVNQKEFMDNEPAEWAKWNDERRGDNGENSRKRLTAAINALDAEIPSRQAELDNEPDPDVAEEKETALNDIKARRARFNAVLESYNAPTEEVGPFGRIFREYFGKAKEAISRLIEEQGGEAIGALSHPEVGAIDLVWGEEGTNKSDGFGLAKLVKYHPEVVENLQEILNDMHITSRSDNRINLESDRYKAAVRLTWDNARKTWLLTAFEKKNSALDNTTDTGETPSGERNDTATPQDTVSESKDNENSEETNTSEENSPAEEAVEPEAPAEEPEAPVAPEVEEQPVAEEPAVEETPVQAEETSVPEAETETEAPAEETVEEPEAAEETPEETQTVEEIEAELENEGLAPHDSLISRFIQSIQRLISTKAKATGKLNLYKYTDDNGGLRPQMGGVYHSNGYAIASDSYVVIADKASYDKKNDGKIIGKDGKAINEKYPDVATLFKDIDKWQKDKFDFAKLREFLAGMKAQLESEWKEQREKGVTAETRKSYVNGARVLLNLDTDVTVMVRFDRLSKFADYAERIGSKDIIFQNDKRLLAVKTDKGYAGIMPQYKGDYLSNVGRTNEETAKGANEIYHIYSFGENGVTKRFEKAFKESENAKKKEEKRQEELIKRAEKWKKFVGDSFVLLRSEDDIEAMEESNANINEALNAVRNGNHGWYSESSDKAYIYLPNIKDEAELDKKIMHEVLTHEGLLHLLGREQYDNLLDEVWDSMNEAQRAWAQNYYDRSQFSSDEAHRRAGTEEFLAKVAEKDESIAAIVDKNFWTKFVEKVKEFINKMLEEPVFTNEVKGTWISNYLMNSFVNLAAEKQRSEVASTVEENPQVPVARAQEKTDENGRTILFSRAFHGSTNDFDQFDLFHAGEGSGSASHGYGHYVALNRETGEGYAWSTAFDHIDEVGLINPELNRILSNDEFDSYEQMVERYDALLKDRQQKAKEELEMARKEDASDTSLINGLQSDYEEIMSYRPLAELLEGTRNLYTVEIPDDNGENYIDEMKTLAKPLRKRIADVVREIPDEELDRLSHGPNWLPQGFNTLANIIEREPYAGLEIRTRLEDALGNTREAKKETSEILHKAGFVGMKYDGRFDGPCAVIFSDDDIKIVEHLKFSKATITPEMDAAYLTAVEAGDMAKAQDIVDQAAQTAGYTVKAYHGSLSTDITRFDKDKIGSRFSYDERGFFFTSAPTIAKYYASSEFDSSRKGKVYPVFLGWKNPLVVDAKFARKEGLGWRFSDMDAIEVWDNYQSFLLDKVDEGNHDGVLINDGQTQMYVVFDANQIKLADPVTYDDNGNVIPLSERFNKDNPDIRFREAVGPVARLAEAEREVVDRKLNEMGSALGIPVNRVSRDQMPKGHENDKGYYDPQTGEMYICMDNVAGINDAVATVLHESVGHLGLRRLLGDRFASTMQQIYAALDEKGRTWVNHYIATHNEAPATRAVEEYLSYLAESGDFMTTERSVWQQIKDIIARAIDAVFGTDFFSFTDDELNYILRASYENLQNPNWLNTVEGWAKDNLMRATLGFNSLNPEQTEDDEILFRENFTPIGNAADDYDQRVKLNHNKMVTEVQNLNRPVQIAYEEVMKETGKKKITEAEDYTQRAEQAGSRAQTEQEQFERDHAVPILEQVREIQSILLKKSRQRAKEDANDTIEGSRKKRRIKAYEQVLDYLYAVSALERNRYKNAELAEQKKNAIEEAETKAEEKRAKVRAEMKDKAQANALAKIDNDLNNELAEIEEKYAPRDWSGLTSLEGVYDNNALNALRPKPTDNDKRRAELKKQREALRRSWWPEAERRAEERIERMRRLVGDEQLNRLWDLIREATDFNLQHALDHGLLTKEEYDRLHGTEETPRMWNYYLPLRGFTEETAEQQYDYSHIANPTGGSAVVKKMNGRWSEADNPLANLFNIAQREIAQGWDNWAKMALYRFALNAGENSLLSVKEAWYEKNPETGEWSLAQPRADETMDEFENRMQSLKENKQEDGTKGQPLAKKGRRGLELNKIRGSHGGENEHIVRLKVAGQDKVVWVNGDPAMAKAVNGTSRGHNMALIRRASRALSNLFTTYSLNFSIKNLFRDTIYSQLALHVKEDRKYRHRYYKNWIRNMRFLAGPMVRLSRQYENGTLQKKRNLTERERLFIDFMNDGGATGYSIVNSVDTFKRDIERSMRRGGKKVSKYRVPLLGHYAEFVKTLNEGFELLTRFTAYETSRQEGRSGQRAASDAKEISVNFNRRGAQSGEGFWGMTAAYFGATHYFFNAGVQGFDNFMNLIKTKPAKMTTFMAGFAMMGFLTPLINSMLAGMLDDDEDENYDWYWELPQWVRRNNLVMGYRGYYFAIPLSVEVRAIYGLGDIAAMVAFSKYAGDNGFNVGLDAMSTAMGILPINPVEDYTASGNFSDTALRNFAPDIMMPLVDIATNRDYTGRPLSKENPFTHNTPKSQAAFASTPKYLVKACQAIAKATATAPIHLDPNPGVWRDIFKSYGGGFYKTAEDIAKITMIDTDHPFRWDNMPFMSGFTGHLDEDRSNSFEIDALNAYKDMSEDVVRRLNSVTGGGVTPTMAFKNPDSLPDIAKAQIILEGKKYQLAKTYYDGMRNVYEINPKTGKEYTSGAKHLKHKGLNKMYDEWKALYDEWKLMPNASESEKEAKAAKTLEVQQAWNLYRNAQGNLVDMLLEMENGERLSGLEADAYELTKGLVF